MNRIHLPRHLAMTALAMLLTAPAVYAQNDVVYRHSLIPIPHTGITTDEINGNDVRDTRDSTIVRNDVPLDESRTGLPSNEATYRSDTSTSALSDSASRGVVTTRTPGDLPATAVAEAGDGTVTTPHVAGAVTAPRSSQGEMTDPGTASLTDTHGDRMPDTERPGNHAVMPDDGGGEIGVPAPPGAQTETDSFEGNRDTAAGVESTRGAGGAGAGGAGR